MHKHVPVTSNSRIPYLHVSSSSSLILPLFSLYSDHVCMDPLRSGLPVPGGHEDAAAPCLGCPMPLAASARRHLEVDATLLRGCAHSHKNPSFPAVSTDSKLEANLRRPLLLSCYDQSTFLGCQRRSTCSVLSASICRKKSWDYDKCRYTIHLKLIQINSNSYDNFTNLTLMLLNSNNFQPRQMHAAENKKTPQPFLSARHWRKSASFKWSHLALRTFCHAAAGICEQLAKYKSSSCVDWLKAWSKSAAPSAPWASSLKHLQCFGSIDLLKGCWEGDKSRYILS